MAPREYGATTLREKFGIASTTFRAFFYAFLSLLEAPFVGKRGAPTTLRHVVYSLFRTTLGEMGAIQQQSINPRDEQTYLKLAEKRGFSPDIVVLPDGVNRGFWIGPRTASKVYLYFHGGGYALPSDPNHMRYWYELQQELSKQGHDFSVVFLDYTLAPQAVYPTQLKQAAEFLKHLIEVEGKDPSNLIIGGDSAGGNLTMSLISHLLHPHPSGIPAVKLSSPLRGAVLISPWVSFNCDTPSFTRNAKSDILNAGSLTTFARAFIPSADEKAAPAGDNYNEAAKAPADWWSGIDSVVKNMLIWGGADEVLVDSIKQLATVLESEHENVKTIIGEDNAHDQFIIDLFLGYPKAKTTVEMEGWIKSLL